MVDSFDDLRSVLMEFPSGAKWFPFEQYTDANWFSLEGFLHIESFTKNDLDWYQFPQEAPAPSPAPVPAPPAPVPAAPPASPPPVPLPSPPARVPSSTARTIASPPQNSLRDGKGPVTYPKAYFPSSRN